MATRPFQFTGTEERSKPESEPSRWQRRIRFGKFLEQFRSWRFKVSDHYTYRVTWSPDDSEHVGLCLEFPSLSWLASTPEEAFTGARRLVAEVVLDMRGSDESPPVPLADRSYSGRFIVRLPPRDSPRAYA